MVVNCYSTALEKVPWIKGSPAWGALKIFQSTSSFPNAFSKHPIPGQWAQTFHQGPAARVTGLLWPSPRLRVSHYESWRQRYCSSIRTSAHSSQPRGKGDMQIYNSVRRRKPHGIREKEASSGRQVQSRIGEGGWSISRNLGATETAQWLKAFTAFAKDLSSVGSSHARWLTTS